MNLEEKIPLKKTRPKYKELWLDKCEEFEEAVNQGELYRQELLRIKSILAVEGKAFVYRLEAGEDGFNPSRSPDIILVAPAMKECVRAWLETNSHFRDVASAQYNPFQVMTINGETIMTDKKIGLTQIGTE